MKKEDVVFNPFTGNFDYVEVSITKSEIVQMFLYERDETFDPPRVSFLFDENTVLYNDDDAEI